MKRLISLESSWVLSDYYVKRPPSYVEIRVLPLMTRKLEKEYGVPVVGRISEIKIPTDSIGEKRRAEFHALFEKFISDLHNLFDDEK